VDRALESSRRSGDVGRVARDNIDNIVIGPPGIYVFQTKSYLSSADL